MNLGTGAVGVADDLEAPLRHAKAIFLGVELALPANPQAQDVGQCIDHRDADAMQTPGDFIRILVKLAAGVQDRHDDLRGGAALGLHDAGWDSTPVIRHGHRLVGVDDDLDPGAESGEGLVDGVVDDLEHHVVQTGAVIGVADVHPGPLAHRVKALENPYIFSAVGFFGWHTRLLPSRPLIVPSCRRRGISARGMFHVEHRPRPAARGCFTWNMSQWPLAGECRDETRRAPWTGSAPARRGAGLPTSRRARLGRFRRFAESV